MFCGRIFKTILCVKEKRIKKTRVKELKKFKLLKEVIDW